MRRLGVPLAVLALSARLACAGGPAFGPGFGQVDLDAITETLGDVVSFPNLGTAVPGGVAGFDVLVAAGGPKVDTSAGWWRYVPHSNVVADVLVGQRVIVRKGLPLRLDVGAQFGKVFGDEFWGADVRWAFTEGGALEPAIALRAAYSHLDSSLLDRLDTEEVQLVASKGFPVVSVYGGIGYRRLTGRASFGDPTPVERSSTRTGATWTVGTKLAVLPFLHFVGEVRGTTQTCVFVGAGVGL